MQQFPTAQLFTFLRKKWWIILSISVVVGVGTYLYTLTLPPYYKSTANCVPPKQDQNSLAGALGAAGAALKDFGLTKLAGAKSGESYDFIVLLYSRGIRDSLIKQYKLVEEYEMQGVPMSKVRGVLESNIEIVLTMEGNYEISIWSKDPNKSVQMCNSFIELVNQLSNTIVRSEATRSTAYLEKRISNLDSTLATIADSLVRYNKDYLIFSPTDQLQAGAKAITETQTNMLKQEMMLGLLEENYGINDPQVKAQRLLVNQLKSKLEDVKNSPGVFGDLSLREGASVSVNFLRLFAEYEAYSKLKAFMYPTLEQTRMDMQRSAPSLIILDPAIPAEEKDKPQRSLITASFAVGSGTLTIMILILIFAFQNNRALEQITKPSTEHTV